MADAHANLAVSAVATAPSPATSGTSLVVTSGHGSRFPTAPFNATVWPTGAQPDPSNAEIVRVTAVSTDTLTITRAQEGTSARTVVVGDQIAATITAKSLTDIETVFYTPKLAKPNNAYRHASGKKNTDTGAMTLNQLYFLPIEMLPGFAYTLMGVSVGTAGSAGSVVRLGLYNRLQDGSVGSLVLDAGTVGSTTTGGKTVAITHTPDRVSYYAAVVAQVAAPSVASVDNNGVVPSGGLLSSDGKETQGCIVQTSVSGSLPSPAVPTGYVSFPVPVVYYGIS